MVHAYGVTSERVTGVCGWSCVRVVWMVVESLFKEFVFGRVASFLFDSTVIRLWMYKDVKETV